MQSVTDATFDQVLKAPLAIAEFWNPSCPNCMRFKPIFAEVAAQMGDRIFMATALTDENQKSAATYGISGIPTTIFFMNGKEVNRAVGAMSKDDFLNEISKSLSLSEAAAAGGTGGAGGVPESTGSVVVGGLTLAAVVAGLVYFVPKI
jgi:thioredoxin 1